jgi:hypothetical protein
VDTKIEMDRATVAKFEKTLSDFVAATGKTAEEGMTRIAKSACRRLASTVQPYGLKGGRLAKFEKSVAAQVDRAWFGTNLGAFPATNSMRDAHLAARRNGRVAKQLFRKEKGKPWLALIPASERDTYKKIAVEKVGRAKAAWVKISNELGKPKMSGLDATITRHLPAARGSHTVSGTGIQTAVTISNDVTYIKKIQYTEDVAKAAAEGMKNGLKWMTITTAKTIEKANRQLK